jgi:hypothetical protein
VTVTVTSPDASATSTIKNQCKGSWTTLLQQPTSPDLIVNPENRNWISYPSPIFWVAPRYDYWEPFLVTVTAAGRLVARQAYTTWTGDLAGGIAGTLINRGGWPQSGM